MRLVSKTGIWKLFSSITALLHGFQLIQKMAERFESAKLN